MNSCDEETSEAFAIAHRPRPYYVYMMRGRAALMNNPRKRRRDDDDGASTAVAVVTAAAAAEAEPADMDEDEDGDESVAPVAAPSASAAAGGSDKSRMYTHVGKSRQPIQKVLRHNQKTVRHVTNKKLMSRVASNWRLEDWIGPFRTRNCARTFQRLWCTQLRRGLPPPPPHAYNATHYSARAPISAQRQQQQRQK